MNHSELKDALQARGWRFGRPDKPMNLVDWYAWHPKRLTGPDCCCNNKPPPLVMYPFLINHNGLEHSSVEFEVAGELPNGRWCNFKLYSVPMAEALYAIPHATAALTASWEAAHGAAV